MVHAIQAFFSSGHPISTYLSLEFLGIEDHALSIATKVPEQFVANRQTGEVHSGFATLLLDTVLGGAVLGEIEELQPIATVGLTTQHMRRAVKGEKLVCRAKLEGMHNGIAYMSGLVMAAETGEVLSTATGTFMIGTRAKPLGARL